MLEEKHKKVTIIIDDGEKVDRYYFPVVKDFKFDVEMHEPQCQEIFGGYARIYKPTSPPLKSIAVSFAPQTDEKTGQYGKLTRRKSRKKN